MTTPIEPRWYCVDANGLATRCVDQSDAQRVAMDASYMFPRSGPHRAVLLGDVAAERETIQRLREALDRIQHLTFSKHIREIARDALKT